MSSAATTTDYAPPAEPFGQTGVRQYTGRMLAWFFLTAGLCAAAMTQRSQTFSDVLEWNGQGQMLRLISANGQMNLITAATPRAKADGWKYRSGYGTRWAHLGPWSSSVGESFGVETRTDLPFREVDRGFWLRLKWPTVAVVLLLQPLIYFVVRIVRCRAA